MTSLADVRLLVRERCREFDDPGADFERLVGELLSELGFFNVRREKAGSQFGRDFSADLDDSDEGCPSHWYFECKNFEDEAIRPADAAPKLLWHLSNDRLTGGFVIVGPGDISNDLHEILERTTFPFSVYNWTADSFAKAVLLCPETCRRWFPKVSDAPPAVNPEWRRQLFEAGTSGYVMKDPLRVTLTAKHRPPFEYAYFFRDGHFQKWDTGFEFVHYLMAFNPSKVPVVVRAIRVRTIAFSELPARVLVQHKAKGRREPRVLEYVPSRAVEGSVELLNRYFLQVGHRETEPVILKLDTATEPGLYEYVVEVEHDVGGKAYEQSLCPLRVCILPTEQRSSETTLRVHVWRKHYDYGARRILALPPVDWDRLVAAEDDRDAGRLHFGPSCYDEMHRRPAEWKIYHLPEEPIPDRPDYFRFIDAPKVVADLGDIPEEQPPPDPRQHLAKLDAIYGPDPNDPAWILAQALAAMVPEEEGSNESDG